LLLLSQKKSTNARLPCALKTEQSA